MASPYSILRPSPCFLLLLLLLGLAAAPESLNPRKESLLESWLSAGAVEISPRRGGGRRILLYQRGRIAFASVGVTSLFFIQFWKDLFGHLNVIERLE